MEEPSGCAIKIERAVKLYESGELSRRAFIGSLTSLIAGYSITQTTLAAESSPFKAVGINHAALRVPDIQRSKNFYGNLFGMPTVSESQNSSFLNMPNGFLALFRGDEPGMDHLCFAVENFNIENASDILKNENLNPHRPPGTNRIYFNDPDGIRLQLSGREHHP